MLISRTPPSKPASVLKLLLNETRTSGAPPNAGAAGTAISGETNSLPPGVVALAPKAPFGGVGGVPAVDVTQRTGPPVGLVLAVVQPAGSAGAVTPSKFSVKVGAIVCRTPRVKVKLKLPRSKSPSCRWKVSVIVPPQLRA